jgi:predicted RNA-binding protein with EMAP domain
MSYKVKIELEFENYKPNKEEVFKYIKELHEDNSLDYQLIDNKKLLHEEENKKDKEDAQETVENEGDCDWNEDYDVQFGDHNEYSLEEIEEDK